ncbi:hypothetical protein BC826DRAFT_919555 [Russula brevipes]|nr:hypothetical protein BC826DRAFT_919555 [Russula brevipes]
MAPAPLAQPAGTEDAEGSGDEEEAEEEGDSDADADADADGELALFSLISDPARYDGISNLRALRLLFDVSVRAAPVPTSLLPELRSGRRQQQQQRQHRLTCLRGLQEAYDTRGRTLWIFDARSRADGCARLVSEAGDVATGDSWRARATHMAELQANLAARALRIDFGGLDRWDYVERQRNMSEADAGYVPIHSEMS